MQHYAVCAAMDTMSNVILYRIRVNLAQSAINLLFISSIEMHHALTSVHNARNRLLVKGACVVFCANFSITGVCTITIAIDSCILHKLL